MNNKTMKILLSVVLIGGSVTYLLTTTMSEAVEYYHPAAKVIAEPATVRGQRIKIGGTVAHGSVFQKPGTLEYQFEVSPTPGESAAFQVATVANKTITVRYTGVVPDTFKEDNQVVVSGMLAESNVFMANDLTAKCPSKYEAQEKTKGTY